MNPTKEDLNALRQCIDERWKILSDPDKCNNKVPGCQLCTLGYERSRKVDPESYKPCSFCIVQRETGLIQCAGTPYYKWWDLSKGKRKLKKATGAAKEMEEWLESLYSKIEKEVM
jgi:hypothetical protein